MAAPMPTWPLGGLCSGEVLVWDISRPEDPTAPSARA